jgi:hypothetical protein
LICKNDVLPDSGGGASGLLQSKTCSEDLLTVVFVIVGDWYRDKGERLLDPTVGDKPELSDNEMFDSITEAGRQVSGQVIKNDMVAVTLTNQTGKTRDLPAGTVRADVWRHRIYGGSSRSNAID